MTLILTCVERNGVFQMSDRLVTLSTGHRWDTAANKNILYFGGDCILSLGYTGVAYVGSATMDEWLAEALTGQTTSRNEHGTPVTTLSVPAGPRPRMGTAMRTLAAKLTWAHAVSGLIDDRYPPTLIIAGWQWGRKHVNSLAGVVAFDRVTRAYHPFLLTPRYWRYFGRRATTEDGKAVVLRACNVQAVPLEYLSIAELTALREDACGAESLADLEGVLLNAIRTVADRARTVGKDCVGVLLPRPGLGIPRIRYYPESTIGVNAPEPSLPPAAPIYSPWIVGPGVFRPPSVQVGPSVLSFDKVQVAIDGSAPGQQSWWMWAGQTRRPPPRRR